MKETPREFAQKMAQSMREILEGGREAIPLCFVVPKQGKINIVAFEFPEGQGSRPKDTAAYVMQMFKKDPEIDFVVFLSDAWCVEIRGNKGNVMEEYQKYGSVKDMPQRSEGIVVSIFGNRRLNDLGTWKYRRQGKKLVFATPQIEWQEGASQIEGRFVPQEPPHAKQ